MSNSLSNLTLDTKRENSRSWILNSKAKKLKISILLNHESNGDFSKGRPKRKIAGRYASSSKSGACHVVVMDDSGLGSAQNKRLHRVNKQPSIDKGAYMMNASQNISQIWNRFNPFYVGFHNHFICILNMVLPGNKKGWMMAALLKRKYVFCGLKLSDSYATLLGKMVTPKRGDADEGTVSCNKIRTQFFFKSPV
jgi:hypothetical protein